MLERAASEKGKGWWSSFEAEIWGSSAGYIFTNLDILTLIFFFLFSVWLCLGRELDEVTAPTLWGPLWEIGSGITGTPERNIQRERRQRYNNNIIHSLVKKQGHWTSQREGSRGQKRINNMLTCIFNWIVHLERLIKKPQNPKQYHLKTHTHTHSLNRRTKNIHKPVFNYWTLVTECA